MLEVVRRVEIWEPHEWIRFWATENRVKVVVVGDNAPDFSITADNGRTVSLSNHGGKLLVLNFWATWCEPCVVEIPSLDAFQKRFANRGVTVLGISIGLSSVGTRIAADLDLVRVASADDGNVFDVDSVAGLRP